MVSQMVRLGCPINGEIIYSHRNGKVNYSYINSAVIQSLV